jgi:tetratricopeptide (TPR) repeat protein
VDPDGDPVRSPDAAGGGVDDGFSSSRMGLASMAAGPDIEATPGKSAKAKTREQVVKDNVDVGEFYLERKNWKAALLRFQDAFTLDSESADAVFGMAEAEDHLEMVDKAREHFELFLAYDAEGPHGKAARKALEQIEREHPLERGTPVAGGKVATPK